MLLNLKIKYAKLNVPNVTDITDIPYTSSFETKWFMAEFPMLLILLIFKVPFNIKETNEQRLYSLSYHNSTLCSEKNDFFKIPALYQAISKYLLREKIKIPNLIINVSYLNPTMFSRIMLIKALTFQLKKALSFQNHLEHLLITTVNYLFWFDHKSVVYFEIKLLMNIFYNIGNWEKIRIKIHILKQKLIMFIKDGLHQ